MHKRLGLATGSDALRVAATSNHRERCRYREVCQLLLPHRWEGLHHKAAIGVVMKVAATRVVPMRGATVSISLPVDATIQATVRSESFDSKIKSYNTNMIRQQK